MSIYLCAVGHVLHRARPATILGEPPCDPHLAVFRREDAAEAKEHVYSFVDTILPELRNCLDDGRAEEGSAEHLRWAWGELGGLWGLGERRDAESRRGVEKREGDSERIVMET